jgi:predicted  nucleic acid-binding Zn-ribbon protein
MRHHDNTGVPPTCPLINEVIAFLESIEEASPKAYIDTMEKIREHNSELRAYCITADERNDELDSEIDKLRDRINELEKEKKDLEEEVDGLQQELGNYYKRTETRTI